MADINSVTLVGRLTRNGECKYTQNGGAIVRFSLAVNRAKRSADGKWEEETSYFDCVYFGKGAEAVNPYLEKGRQVAIQGELRQSRWEQDGATRSRVEIFVNNLSLGQAQGSGRANYQAGSSAPGASFQQNMSAKPQYQSPVPGPENFEDDSIPF